MKKQIAKTLLDIVPIPTTTHQTTRMSEWITSNLHKYQHKHTYLDFKKDKYGNLYYTQKCQDKPADLFPTMVCHIDTVHSINHNIKAYIENDIIYAMDTSDMTQFGTGGDDKVGIAITLHMFQLFRNFKAVFFLDEEHGCLGSNQADKTFFDNSTVVLECDRRGNEDFVNKIGSTKLFGKSLYKVIKPILQSHDRKVVTGGITDVGAIAKLNPVMSANMSCGYFNPHSNSETIHLNDVVKTFYLCSEIFSATQHKRFAYNTIKDRQVHQVYSGWNNYGLQSYGHTFYKPKVSSNHVSKKNQNQTDIFRDYELEECGVQMYETSNEDVDIYWSDEVECICNENNMEYDDYEDEWYCHTCGKYKRTNKLI